MQRFLSFSVARFLGFSVQDMGSSFRDLKAWQEARLLVRDCYKLSATFPRAEIYGLTAQLRSAAISVEANIAEGSGRGSKKEFVQFLRISKGSLHELESYLILAVDLEYATAQVVEPIEERLKSVGRLVAGLVRSLQPGPSNAE